MSERDSNLFGIRKDRRTKFTDEEIIALIDQRVAAGIASAGAGSALNPNAVQLQGDVTGANVGNAIPTTIGAGIITLTKMASSAVTYLLAAVNNTIADAGGFYSASTVEGALAEAAAQNLRVFTKAALPSAAGRALIYVSDLTGGPEPCFSDGTNWRRCSDRSVAS